MFYSRYYCVLQVYKYNVQRVLIFKIKKKKNNILGSKIEIKKNKEIVSFCYPPTKRKLEKLSNDKLKR